MAKVTRSEFFTTWELQKAQMLIMFTLPIRSCSTSWVLRPVTLNALRTHFFALIPFLLSVLKSFFPGQACFFIPFLSFLSTFFPNERSLTLAFARVFLLHRSSGCWLLLCHSCVPFALFHLPPFLLFYVLVVLSWPALLFFFVLFPSLSLLFLLFFSSFSSPFFKYFFSFFQVFLLFFSSFFLKGNNFGPLVALGQLRNHHLTETNFRSRCPVALGEQCPDLQVLLFPMSDFCSWQLVVERRFPFQGGPGLV